MRLFLPLFILGILLTPHSSLAEEGGKAKDAGLEKAGEAMVLKGPEVDYLEEMRDQMDALSEGLSREDNAHFYAIYTAYNMVGTVGIIKGDVSKAVKACGHNNIDLKDPMKTRLDGWQGKIDPILKETSALISTAMKSQTYAEPDDIEDILDLADKVRKQTRANLKREPVTSLEACQNLLKTMDKTEKELVELLRNSSQEFQQLAALYQAEKSDKKDEKTKP